MIRDNTTVNLSFNWVRRDTGNWAHSNCHSVSTYYLVNYDMRYQLKTWLCEKIKTQTEVPIANT